MNDSVMDLSIVNLAIAYIFVLLLLIIFRARGIRRENMILIATTRMTVQLTIMGYILLYVFKNPSWWLTLLMLLIMLGFAIYNAAKRVRYDMSDDLKRLMGVSMTIGYLCTAVVFMLLVLQVCPQRNSMTGIALGANRLCANMQDHREKIENSLMLGASPKLAAHEEVNDAFDSAILPTMNNMMTMGIVSLPGMMTGQMLSGTFPLTAIKYQIGIMLAILGCTAVTVVVFVTLGYKTFFTRHASLK